MDITLPNGHVISGVPEGTTKSQLMNRAIKAGIATYQDFGMEEPQTTDPYAGMSAAQIYEAKTGKSPYDSGGEMEAANNAATSFQKDAEWIVPHKADAIQKSAPSLNREEAMQQARDEYAGDIAELYTDIALSSVLPGAPLVAGSRIVGAGAVGGAVAGTAGMVGNAAAGRDLTEGVMSDVALGAAIGGGFQKLTNALAPGKATVRQGIRDVYEKGRGQVDALTTSAKQLDEQAKTLKTTSEQTITEARQAYGKGVPQREAAEALYKEQKHDVAALTSQAERLTKEANIKTETFSPFLRLNQ